MKHGASVSGRRSRLKYQPTPEPTDLINTYGLTRLIKLSSNENCLGPSASVLEAIQRAATETNRYPSADGIRLREALADHFNVPANRIILGSGSTGVIGLIARAFLKRGVGAISAQQTFPLYRHIASSTGASFWDVPNRSYAIDLDAIGKAIRPDTRVIFLANPNNPTGLFLTGSDLASFLNRVPSNVLVVLDEAYAEYVEHPDYVSGLQFLGERKNLVVLKTFSKVYSLAGLRIGYGVADEEIVQTLNRFRWIYSTGNIADAAAIAALKDQNHVKQSLKHNREQLRILSESLGSMNVRFLPTVTNFLLAFFERPQEMVQGLLRRGILVSQMDQFHVPEGVRITVGLPEENLELIRALREIFNTETPSTPRNNTK